MESRRTCCLDTKDLSPKVPHVKLVDLKHWNNVQVKLTDETKKLFDMNTQDSSSELPEAKGITLLGGFVPVV